jgi:solute carrier family 32 (vesicular inhibitory amino acid transporter)
MKLLVRPGGDHSFATLKKHKSLDFGGPSGNAKTIQQQQLQKAAQNKAYRQQLLQKTTHKSKIVEKEVDAKASFSQCVFNMSNILMGVGMLGLPFVLKAAGWIGGIVVCVGFGTVTWYTSLLIGRALNGDSRPTSYFDDSPYKTTLVPGSSEAARMRPFITSFPQIAREAFGDRGNVLLSAILYFELFSCLCIFLVTMGDHLSRIFPAVSKDVHMLIMSVILTIPTALLRTPRLLSYLSMVGTFATVSVVLAVLLSAFLEGDISARVFAELGELETPRILWSTSGLPLALGLIAYTFSGHAIVPSIYTSMDRPQDFENMIHCTFLIVMGCCLVVAISGYYMFGNAVQDQITLSLEESSSSEAAMECLSTLLSVLPSCAFRCFGSCVRCDAYSANTFSFS